MKIVINASQPLKTLVSAINIGKCFRHETTLYLRLHGVETNNNVDVLNLTTMKLEAFSHNTKVTPVFAELKVWGA